MSSNGSSFASSINCTYFAYSNGSIFASSRNCSAFASSNTSSLAPSNTSSLASSNASSLAPSNGSALASLDVSGVDYFQLTEQLYNYTDIPSNLIDSLQSYIKIINDVYLQSEYSKPMPWIGMYIALASLVCILLMVADLLHGLKIRKLWFPCKYSTLNAASLSIVAAAIKLPMDPNKSMPGQVDQAAKLSSLAFMCTMMVNSLPSLATMDNNELVANVVALGVLVINLVLNVCIQSTGVVSSPDPLKGFLDSYTPYSSAFMEDQNKIIAAMYVVMLLVLLMIYICSALGILEFKRILESKYQAANRIALEDQEHEKSTVEKLKRHISKYWIMAGTGSPQFITVCSATTSASGIICTLSTTLLCIVMLSTVDVMYDFDSEYQQSVPLIFITQSIGVILGTIAPLSRCFASLSFKVSLKWIWDHIKVFKLERYWTQRLRDWKQSCIAFQFRSRKFMGVVENAKCLFLSFCIQFQKTIVVACKMIALLPIFFSALVVVFLNSSKHRQQNKNDLSQYVLQFQDYMEPAERTLKRILKSMNHAIQKAEKHQPKNLKKLLEESRKGVENFDSLHVSPLLSEKYLDSWSLELVTLTTIARSLPNIPKKQVNRLVKSVSEGIAYVAVVDECLNATHEYVNIQKAAKYLWLEVEFHHKWLGKEVKDLATQLKTTAGHTILEWFRETSKNILAEAKCTPVNIEGSVNESTFCIDSSNESTFGRCICAKSMYGITQRILLSYQDTSEEDSGERLFERVSSMISHTLAACLTNLPRVIEMKCQTDLIEKREASVDAAAQLLGETTEIIKFFQDHELSCLSKDKCTSEALFSMKESTVSDI